jgi:hypothetical protein
MNMSNIVHECFIIDDNLANETAFVVVLTRKNTN